MTREQVIKGLECCDDCTCFDCPYLDFREGGGIGSCTKMLSHDALALLKEQEATPVKRIDGKRNHFTKCGNCNADLMSGMKFCPQCGKVVKWE